MLRVEYFARLREAMGRDDETIDPPAAVVTIADLIAWLAARDGVGGAALADRARVRAAIDDAIVRPDAPIAGAACVSLFPPQTGG